MLKKIIASILVVLLVSQVFPINVFAEEITSEAYSEEYNDEYADETIADNTETTEDVYIISEDTSKRDETTKHFLLSNGSYKAVVYSAPIHHKKAGETEWTEIDNTLIEVPDSLGDIYFEPKDSPIDVKFFKNGDSDNLVKYNINGHEISWSYEDGDFGLLKKHSFSSREDNRANSIKRNEDIPWDSVKKTESRLKYNHFYSNVDIEYTVTSEGIKEDIILNDDNVQNEFIIKYDIGSLTATQTDARLITLYNGKNAVAQISAPYMVDSNNESTDALSFEIIHQNDGLLRVKLTADKQWLESDNRAYPVKIDPYISKANINVNNDATALEIDVSSNYPHGSLMVGRNYTYGKCRSFLKYELPTLSAGDMVIDAMVSLYQFAGTQGYSADDNAASQINISKVTSSWTDDSIIASSSFSGLPTAEYNCILDYKTTSSSTAGNWVSFNVGSTVKSWYNGAPNYGFVLWSSGENDSLRRNTTFASADFAEGNVIAKPTLSVIYLNNKGLEDRWTYHSQSLGESGTSYINDCTGNLVFISPVCQTVGENSPASVNLVYNGYLAGTTGSGQGKCGKGWRFDFNQNIVKIVDGSSELHSDLYDAGFRYIFTDADGTDHYFKEKSGESNVYEDEEGLDLTLTVSNSTDAKYTLEFKSGAKNIYKSDGAIRKICDTDNNYYQYIYDSSNRITTIRDGCSRNITISYSDNKVSAVTDPAGRATTFTYTSDCITEITYPDGTSTKFEYDNSNRLVKCIGIDGTALAYEYPDSTYNTVKNRVTKVKQLSTSGTEGDFLNINYSYNSYTIFTDKQNRSEKYLFDTYGRTICINDADGGGASYKYNTSTDPEKVKQNNTLASAATKTKYVNNLLMNHSFESGSANWLPNGNGGTCSIDTENAYLGAKSFKIEKTTEGNLKWYQKISINSTYFKVGGTYTFSAYVKTTKVNTQSLIYANCFGSNGSIYCPGTQKVNEVTDYKRISVTFTVPQNTTYVNFVLSSMGTSGTTYFDCIQVEEGEVANDYNLLENSSFDNTSSTVWKGYSNIDAGTYAQLDGNNVYKLTGAPSGKTVVFQDVQINKLASDCAFSISAKSKANSIPLSDADRCYNINAVLLYSNGDEEYIHFKFNPDISEWQYNSGMVKASKADENIKISYMRIRLLYYYNANIAYFDDISLNIDQTGTSYTYDANGNLTSAIDNAKNNQKYTFNNANELIEAEYQDNTTYEYTYDTTNEHRLLSAKSAQSNINISYAYNNKGFVTTTTVTGGDKSIVTTNGYSGTNSNFLSSVTDALGNTTSYTYNVNKGTIATVKDSAETITNYTYNANNDYLTQVAVSGTDSKVDYNYNSSDRSLSSIRTNTVTYGFDYNNFMQLESVSAGSDTLITNSYKNGYGNLTQSQYGNGDKVLYSYDSLDRVIDKWYYNTESGTYAQYEWAYDAANRVASFTDVPESKVYRYTYDLSGRLTEMNRNDGAYIRTAYDTKNLTTGLTYGFGGLAESTSFTYKETMDNAPENANFTDGSSSSIAYDSLGRKYRDYITSPSGRVLTSTYSYVDHATVANRTSGLVSKIDYNLSTLDDIEYEYDSRGNITKITYGDLICDKYTYDSLNRLIQSDSELYDQTCVYTYDASGNILTKTIYDCDYIDEPLSEKDLVDTITYTYGSADWKDKLTAYDGNYIDYDEIGNPLSYNGKTFTWVGRRLDTYTSDSNTTSYTYNSDGIRTSKTVGSTKTEYFLNGSQILAQKTGSNVIPFYYDANGTRIAFKYNGTMYYYVYNLQGDVTHILNASGGIVDTYEYDEWGKILNLGSLTAIAQANPFRYRGYYYDTESGLYYLNSRYYNAEWGRFINVDALLDQSTVLGMNLFAYCINNPVMFVDPFGLCAKAWAAGYQGPCPGQGLPGCMDNWTQFQENSTIVSAMDPNSPPDHPNYNPPKKWDGKKVKNPNGSGKGWPAKDGGVWVPTPNMHGGEGWTIQYPGGDHSHAYPGGNVRNHFQREQSMGKSVIMIFAGAAFTGVLVADNITGVGVADDYLIAGSTACFFGGINGMFGKKVCTECGEIKYGY